MPKTPPGPAKLRFQIRAGWCHVVFGSLVVACVVLYYLGEQDFVAHAIHAKGTVVGNERSTSVGKDHADRYLTVFTFTDATGKAWQVTDGGLHYHSQPAGVGQACGIIYSPDQPAAAELERPDTFLENMGLGLVFGPCGLLVAACRIFAVRRGRALLRQQSAGAGDASVARDPATLASP